MAFDAEIKELLDATYLAGMVIDRDHVYTSDQLRMAIVGKNLRGMVNMLLVAAEKPDEIKVDYHQMALGILGTVDFLTETLPDLDNLPEKGEAAHGE